jgi:hypothetical protein
MNREASLPSAGDLGIAQPNWTSVMIQLLYPSIGIIIDLGKVKFLATLEASLPNGLIAQEINARNPPKSSYTNQN